MLTLVELIFLAVISFLLLGMIWQVIQAEKARQRLTKERAERDPGTTFMPGQEFEGSTISHCRRFRTSCPVLAQLTQTNFGKLPYKVVILEETRECQGVTYHLAEFWRKDKHGKDQVLTEAGWQWSEMLRARVVRVPACVIQKIE